jgi:hypothetical protein
MNNFKCTNACKLVLPVTARHCWLSGSVFLPYILISWLPLWNHCFYSDYYILLKPTNIITDVDLKIVSTLFLSCTSPVRNCDHGGCRILICLFLAGYSFLRGCVISTLSDNSKKTHIDIVGPAAKRNSWPFNKWNVCVVSVCRCFEFADLSSVVARVAFLYFC